MSKIFSEYPYVDYENFNLDWILKKMKECIQRYHDNEESIDALQVELQDLRDYVDQYFASQDFETLIRQVLDEMEGDGTLERIINEEIFESLNDKIDHKLPDAAFRNVGVIPYGYFINNKRVNLGYNIHAGAICADGQTQYIVGSDAADNTDGLGIFRTISIQTNNDYVNTIRTARVGHSNSICVYNDNELLVAPVRLGPNTDASNYVFAVYVLNRSGAVVRELTTPDWVHSVTRDPITGKVYVILAGKILYEINPENDYMTLVKDLSSVISSSYNQDCAMYDGILYCTSSVGAICAVDVTNENILWSGKVDCIITNGNINTIMGELDGMEFTENGNLLCLFDQMQTGINQYVGFVCEILVGTATASYSLAQDIYGAYGSTSSTYAQNNTRIVPSRTRLGWSRDVKDFDIISLINPRYQAVDVNESYTRSGILYLPPWITCLRVLSGTFDVGQIRFMSPDFRINVAGGATLILNANLLCPIGTRLVVDGTGSITASKATELTDLTGNYRHGRIISVDPRLTFTNVLLDGEAITAGTHIYNLVS